MLESLGSEIPNIKDLSLEEHSTLPELKFDPEKEITDEDWQGMERELNSLLEKFYQFQDIPYQIETTAPYYFRLAFMMKTISPERFKSIEYSNDILTRYKSVLSQNGEVTKNYFFLGYAKTLEPSSVNSVDYENKYQELCEIAFNALPSGLIQAGILKMLFPDKNVVNELDSSSDYIFELVEQRLKYFLDTNKVKGQDVVNIVDIFSYAANARLLFPDKNIESFLSQDEWRDAEDELNSFREKGKEYCQIFAEMSAYMTILSAKKAEITSDGLKVEMGESDTEFNTSTPPIPNQRSF